MKKVLHVIRNIGNGGTERYLFNLLEHTYKDYENIIISYGEITHWQDELNKMNIKVIKSVSPKKIGIWNNLKFLIKVMKEYKIDIVYAYTHFNCGYVMLAAALAKVKVRIAHSHRSSSDTRNKIYMFVSKFLIDIFSTNCLACGNEAAKSLFFKYKKYLIINNGINIEDYCFDVKSRKKYREELNLNENDIVIGTVGRIDENKNHKFLIKIFNELKKEETHYKLVIVGNGNKFNELKELIQEYQLEHEVILMGDRTDVNKIYNVFDIFTLTSIKEGLPYVLIEAQANGLSCIVSDSVDHKSDISNSIVFINLNEELSLWVNKIQDVNLNRKDNTNELIKNGYSLQKEIEKVRNIYEGKAIG